MPPAIFPPGVPVAKRLFDLVITLPGILILFPVMLVIAVLVWFTHGWPIFFRQARPGYRGKIFVLTKFTTMRNTRAPDGNLLPDSERLTALGKLLRSTSMDELPELFHVAVGQMSLVGPRPLLVKYLPLYSPEQMRRHDVLPGITGWAQINGRNAIRWDVKFRLDIWYVDHWSLWLDVKILVLTAWKVIQREGISEPGQATAREFDGKN